MPSMMLINQYKSFCETDRLLIKREETDKQNGTYKAYFLEKSAPFVAKTQSLTAAATVSFMADCVFVFVSMVRQILRKKKKKKKKDGCSPFPSG